MSAGAHKDSVRGVRWLGTSARLITFASERVGDGWRNTLLLTDIRNRASAPLREVGCRAINACQRPVQHAVLPL